MLSLLRRQKFLDLFDKFLDLNQSGFVDPGDAGEWARANLKHAGVAAQSPEGQALAALVRSFWGGFIRELDANKDGAVSKDELLAGIEKLSDTQPETLKTLARDGAKVFMQTLDKDRDGKISRDEFVAFYSANAPDAQSEGEQRFQLLDANGSGFLTMEHVEQAWMEYFFSDDPNAPGNGILGPRS